MKHKKKLFNGGVIVPHRKNTETKATLIMPVPKKVIIPMQQHIGAPCELLVKKGDIVKVGQLIGDTDKFVSAPIHSSVSGKVISIKDIMFAGGYKVKAAEIETDGKQEIHESVKTPDFSSKKQFISIIRNSGLVGLGGAGFPAHIKLAPPPDKKIDLLIINAAECEPYITADYRESIENSWNVISGINIVKEQLGIKKVVIGVEDNKPETIKVLDKIAKTDIDIDIMTLPSKYPQGAEKMLIYAVSKRKVPAGGLPSDVGVIVMNVASVSFVAEYIKTGMPLIRKRLTIDGSAVKTPCNIEVPVGTVIKDAIDFCGGLKSQAGKILMGGPMMGLAQYTMEMPILKQNNAILVLNKKDSILPEESTCIRCGRCVEVCPMQLLPLKLDLYSRKNMPEELGKLDILSCIECGSCAYVCPAKKTIVQAIKLGKQIYKTSIKNEGGK